MHEADGIILVYNPDSPGQDEQIADWLDFFVRKNGLSDEQCMVFAHRTNPSSNQSDKFRPRKQYVFILYKLFYSSYIFSTSFKSNYIMLNISKEWVGNEICIC